MVDLDEGERLLRLASQETGNDFAHTRQYTDWAHDNAPALIAELRAARSTIEAQLETIAALRGELDCIRTKDRCP